MSSQINSQNHQGQPYLSFTLSLPIILFSTLMCYEAKNVFEFDYQILNMKYITSTSQKYCTITSAILSIYDCHFLKPQLLALTVITKKCSTCPSFEKCPYAVSFQQQPVLTLFIDLNLLKIMTQKLHQIKVHEYTCDISELLLFYISN